MTEPPRLESRFEVDDAVLSRLQALASGGPVRVRPRAQRLVRCSVGRVGVVDPTAAGFLRLTASSRGGPR